MYIYVYMYIEEYVYTYVYKRTTTYACVGTGLYRHTLIHVSMKICAVMVSPNEIFALDVSKPPGFVHLGDLDDLGPSDLTRPANVMLKEMGWQSSWCGVNQLMMGAMTRILSREKEKKKNKNERKGKKKEEKKKKKEGGRWV